MNQEPTPAWFIPVNTEDNWLHVILGVVGLVAARRARSSARPLHREGLRVGVPERVRPAPLYSRPVPDEATVVCTHLDQVEITELPESVEGCEECLKTGDPWLHLRICLVCGKVGCCDQSPNRHATAHAEGNGHPLIRSLQPGELWSWCYPDETMLLIDEVHGQTRIPPSPLGG